jgi:large subunit ribosomal protein L30
MAELKITLERSAIGHPQDQKDTVRILGLHRMHQTVIVPDNPSIRGMLHKVRHLVVVETVETAGAEKT